MLNGLVRISTDLVQIWFQSCPNMIKILSTQQIVKSEIFWPILFPAVCDLCPNQQHQCGWSVDELPISDLSAICDQSRYKEQKQTHLLSVRLPILPARKDREGRRDGTHREGRGWSPSLEQQLDTSSDWMGGGGRFSCWTQRHYSKTQYKEVCCCLLVWTYSPDKIFSLFCFWTQIHSSYWWFISLTYILYMDYP